MFIYALLTLLPAVSLAARVDDFVGVVFYAFDQNKNNEVDFGEYMKLVTLFTVGGTNEVKCLEFPKYNLIMSAFRNEYCDLLGVRFRPSDLQTTEKRFRFLDSNRDRALTSDEIKSAI